MKKFVIDAKHTKILEVDVERESEWGWRAKARPGKRGRFYIEVWDTYLEASGELALRLDWRIQRQRDKLEKLEVNFRAVRLRHLHVQRQQRAEGKRA